MVPGLTMLSYSVVIVVDIFVPIYGRSKLAANPETPIGLVLAVTACILALMTVRNFEHKCAKVRNASVDFRVACCIEQGKLTSS